MSKKNKNTYVKKDKVETKKKDEERVYRNPANSKVGKIIIVSLALLMALSGLITLIWYMVTKL